MSQFRTIFPNIPKSNSWFPLHMATGLRKIQRIIGQIDCVIEVHDARIPISGRSTSFHQQVVGGRPHILLLNKMDLIDLNFKNDIDKKLMGTCDRVIYTQCKSKEKINIDKILPEMLDVLNSKPRYHRRDTDEINMLIVGVPNVGKSSIINALREIHLGRPKVMAVAPEAGCTKTLSERLKISLSPPVYLVDTPGILEPHMTMSESALRLGVCGLLKDSAVGLELLADYLLFWFNRRKLFHYANVLGLPEPMDNIREVLARIAVNRNFILNIKDSTTRQLVPRLDIPHAAEYFLKLFRGGTLGTYLLDDDLLYRTRHASFKIAV